MPCPPHARSMSNAIVACAEVTSVPTRCIQVDSPSSLFLAGEGFTPTHNTAMIAGIALAHLVGPLAIANGEIYSAANDREQAAIVFKFAKQIVELDWEFREAVELVPSTKTMIGRVDRLDLSGDLGGSGDQTWLLRLGLYLRRARAGQKQGALRRPGHFVRRTPGAIVHRHFDPIERS